MNRRRGALPRPRTVRLSGVALSLEEFGGASSRLAPEDLPLAVPEKLEAALNNRRLADALRRRRILEYETEGLDGLIDEIVTQDICGGSDESQDVELYDGSLGVTLEFVSSRQASVGRLRWRKIEELFAGPGESPGTVSGALWGSGFLVSADCFLTAGHCFDQEGNNYIRPSRHGKVIEPSEIAPLLEVDFLYQKDSTGRMRSPVSLPIVELLEHRRGDVDFALVRLGRDGQGRPPGDLFGWLQTAPAGSLSVGDLLCCIQHPGGGPKKVETGPVADLRPGRIWYDSLDTANQSSGSPLLGPTGEVVGIHAYGGCFWGANEGVSIDAVRSVSIHLR